MEITEVLGIISTSILAVAVVLTYLVQRARYLKEIEPDLVLTTNTGRIRVKEINETLKKSLILYIDIDVKNVTTKHVEQLKYNGRLTIWNERGKPYIITTSFKERVYQHQRNLLPNRNMLVPVYIGWNLIPGLLKKIKSSNGNFETEKIGMEAEITISYKSKGELLLYFLLPIWYRGRARYMRTVTIGWYFKKIIEPVGVPPFYAISWDKHDIIRYTENGESAEHHVFRST